MTDQQFYIVLAFQIAIQLLRILLTALLYLNARMTGVESRIASLKKEIHRLD